jgi:hypothetical protein
MKPDMEKVLTYFMTFALMLFGAGLLGLGLAIVKLLQKYWEMGNPL